MKCSAFIATSVDGYIATPEGSVAWLDTAGVTPPEGISDDGGFGRFLASVDCLVMGRKTLEVIAGFNLTPDTLEEQPYSVEGAIQMFEESNVRWEQILAERSAAE